MLLAVHYRVMEHVGSLESTQEARVALGYRHGNSYASFVFSKLPACFITRQCTLKHEPIVNECECYAITETVFGSPVPWHKLHYVQSCLHLNIEFIQFNAAVFINFSSFGRAAFVRGWRLFKIQFISCKLNSIMTKHLIFLKKKNRNLFQCLSKKSFSISFSIK